MSSGTSDETAIRAIRARLNEPLRVAIAGRVKAGKSTLLNAMVGERIASTGVGECTRVLTWYRAAEACQVTLYPDHGPPEHVPFARNGSLQIDLAGYPVEEIRSLVVDWPSAHLRAMTLIDTPGLASLSAHLSARTSRLLSSGSNEGAEADAVIYLMRHLHAADARALEAFQDREIANPTAINALGVLARADEIGVARLDAMDSARRIAAHYSANPSIRRLCQTVVPVCGLLAEAAATLRETEYRSLAALATMSEDQVTDLLVSVHHFARDERALPVPASARITLLERLGMFGVRVCVEFLRRYATATVGSLVEHLREQSGILDLQALIRSQFELRSDVLKARSALSALALHLQGRSDDRSRTLLGGLERVLGQSHEFQELRLYAALRAGWVQLTEDELTELEVLLGSTGNDLLPRLALPTEAPANLVRDTIIRRVEYWQRRAENPLTTRRVVDAARIVIRSYEGLLSSDMGNESPVSSRITASTSAPDDLSLSSPRSASP